MMVATHIAGLSARDEDLATQLQRLLDRLDALPPILHEFVRRFDAGISVGYSAGATNRNFGFHVDRRTVERLAVLRLALDLDLYPICPEDGQVPPGAFQTTHQSPPQFGLPRGRENSDDVAMYQPDLAT